MSSTARESLGAAGFPEQGAVQSTLDAKEESCNAAPMALRHFCQHCYLSMGSPIPMGAAGLGLSP